jgi:hypothetical protein
MTTERDSDTNDSCGNNRPPTAVQCGLIGIYMMAAICGIKFLAAIPRLFTASWTWTELAMFPLQIIVLGFFPGVATGLLLPLRRYGNLGYFVIGSVCANVYLLACFALFEFDGLIHAKWPTVVAFAIIATVGGGPMGMVIAHDARSETARSTERKDAR